MDSAKVSVFEKTNKVGLSRFLKGKDSRALESEVSLEVLSNLTNKSLEGKLADEQLSGLLVSADLTKSHSAWSVSVGFLHTSSSRSGFAVRFGSELLSGGLASSRLSCGLLGTSHCSIINIK